MRCIPAVLSALLVSSAAKADYFVSDFGSFFVKQYNDAGGFVRDIPTASAPAGIATGPNGLVYVALRDNTIRRINPFTGAFDGYVASGGGLSFPDQVAIGPNGDLFVASFGSGQVLRYDGNTGAFQGVFATTGGPRSLAFGPGGDLFVDDGGRNVFRFNGVTGAAKGLFVTIPGSPGSPDYIPGIAATANKVYLSEDLTNVSSAGLVGVYDGTGALLNTLTLASAGGSSIAPDGDFLVIGNSNNNQVFRFDGATNAPEGPFISGLGRGFGITFAPVPEPAGVLIVGMLAAGAWRLLSRRS